MGLLGAGLVAGQSGAGAGKSERSIVAVVNHGQATDDDGAGRPEVVGSMVDRTMLAFTGKETVEEAWAGLVSADDVVGIKVNVRGGPRMSTQPCVVASIVAGLQAVGVKEQNILIWDAWNRELPPAGYAINESDQGIRCYGSDRGVHTTGTRLGRDELRKKVGEHYSDRPVKVADREVFFTRIIEEEITALINVPLIKDHRIAGLTCSMKNHYGSILNPSDLHGNACDPYLAALNATPPIRDKTRLILVDGLRGLYNGGPRDKPQWRFRPNCIVAGTDPVAIDSYALEVLERERKEKGMPPLGPRVRYLATAAEMGVGQINPEQIEFREVDLTPAT